MEKKKNLTNESPPIISNQYKNISLKKPSIKPKLKLFELLKVIMNFLTLLFIILLTI